jgi:UDP-2,3-diacylglucosamine hydrolase
VTETRCPPEAGQGAGDLPGRGAVISDLHLLTNRTTVQEHWASIAEAAERCDLFVFNGDIFDFKWSQHGGFQQSVRIAEAWIRTLVTGHPTTRFVFLLGNHDCIDPYKTALDGIQRYLPNFQWHEYWFRLNEKVFLHGDVCHAGGTAKALRAYRNRWSRMIRTGTLSHAAYWAVGQSGIPAVAPRFLRRKACARGILNYLKEELGPGFQEIEEVYFGHVHTAFRDFRMDGLTFHNTGAAMKGMDLEVFWFSL